MQYICQFTMLDFHIISWWLLLSPLWKIYSKSSIRKNFENLTFSLVNPAFPTGLLRHAVLKEDIVFVKLLKKSFRSDIIVSFSEIQCQGPNTFGSIWECEFLKVSSKGVCDINDAWILFWKVGELLFLVIRGINSSH